MKDYFLVFVMVSPFESKLNIVIFYMHFSEECYMGSKNQVSTSALLELVSANT